MHAATGWQALMPAIILTAQLGKGDQAWADGLRRLHYPPERNQVKAHITLFRHLPPAYLPEIKARVAAMARECPAPLAIISDVMLWGQGVAYRLDSPDLLAVRDELAECFTGLLTPQDQARPKLHITVQNKVEPKIAKSLHAELLANFQPRTLAVTGLSAYHYRDGPWEPIQSWVFSGRSR
jgi:2'-5' RNA ligase superfamily